MAEQISQSRDLSGLEAQFRSAMEGLTHERGFAVVRTVYATENDEAQWASALEKLRAYAAPNDSDAEMDPDTFGLPVMADSNLLHGANYASLRKAFNLWVESFLGPEKINDQDEWPSVIRRDVCIVIDERALNSLLKASDLVPGTIPNLDLEPWVAVVDAGNPAHVPYNGGEPYMGFTRAYARVLSQLYDDLGFQSLARLVLLKSTMARFRFRTARGASLLILKAECRVNTGFLGARREEEKVHELCLRRLSEPWVRGRCK